MRQYSEYWLSASPISKEHTMTYQQIEQEIQAKGKTAARIPPARQVGAGLDLFANVK